MALLHHSVEDEIQFAVGIKTLVGVHSFLHMSLTVVFQVQDIV
jgi:hypothetical protein